MYRKCYTFIFLPLILNIETSITPLVVLCTGDEDGSLVDNFIAENDNLSNAEHHSGGI